MGKHLPSKVKLIGLIATTTATIFLRSWQITTFFTLLILGLIMFLKPKKSLADRIYPLFTIGFLVVLFQLFFNTGVTIEARLLTGLATAEKIIILSTLVFLFTTTTSLSEIISLFSFLPPKLQLALTITFSIIPAIIAEVHQITLIQSCRGQNWRGLNLGKSVFPIIIPLLHRTLRRAEQIAMVMEARGYHEE